MSSLSFDPNGVGIRGTLFGLPAEEQSASVILLPVPWEVTVSYGAGTALGPAAILDASAQLDLADPEFDCAWVFLGKNSKSSWSFYHSAASSRRHFEN